MRTLMGGGPGIRELAVSGREAKRESMFFWRAGPLRVSDGPGSGTGRSEAVGAGLGVCAACLGQRCDARVCLLSLAPGAG
jgi:hypothetical protein